MDQGPWQNQKTRVDLQEYCYLDRLREKKRRGKGGKEAKKKKGKKGRRLLTMGRKKNNLTLPQERIMNTICV